MQPIVLLFYQVATRLSQDDIKPVEPNNLVANCQQAVDNLSTSWEQAVRTDPFDKLLEQHCYSIATRLNSIASWNSIATSLL